MLAGLTIFGINLVVHLLGQDPRVVKLMSIYSLGALFIVFSIFQATFAAELNVKVPSLLRVGQRTLLLILVLWAVYIGGGLLYVVIAELTAAFLYISSGYLLSLKHLRPVFRFNPDLCKKLVLMAWPVGVYSVMDQILRRVGIVMLSNLDGEVAVGIFSLAARLTRFLEIFAAATMVSAFPLLSRYYGSDETKFMTVWRASLKYLMALVFLICLMVFCVAEPLVTIIGGDRFAESAGALRVLIWSQVFVYARIIFASMLVAVDKQKVAVVLFLVAILVNGTLDYLLIPRMSYLGACWGAVIAYALIFPIGCYFRELRPYIKDLMYSWFRPGLALLMAMAALFLVDGPMILNVLVVASVYCAVLFLSKTFTKEDFHMMKRIFTR